MNTPNPQPWRISLEDSIRALRSAADEYRAALRLAQTGMWAVDVDRIQFVGGRVAASGGALGRRGTHHPHDRAIVKIGEKYRTLIADLEAAYEQAALLYAYGAAWATSEVIDGRTPELVELAREDSELVPGVRPPSLEEHLDGWSGLAEFKAAHDALVTCENAQAYGEELAGRSYLADHEAGWMHDAWDTARGLADAASAYGLMAERALRFAINVIRSAQPSS